MIKQKIIDLYGEKYLRKSSANIREGDKILAEIIGKENPDVVLEIGTYKGVGSAIISQHCRKVITIDLVNGKVELNQDQATRQCLWEKLGIKNIDFRQVKNDTHKRELIKTLKFDMAFIDGDHSSAGVVRDFNMVKHCGKILFHDYDCSDRENRNEVYEFVNTLKEGVEVNDIFALWKGDRNG